MPGLVPPLADERDLLLAFLGQQRDALRDAAHGLDDARATARPTVSALCLGGLIKHAALVERAWIGFVTTGDTTPFAPEDDWIPAGVVWTPRWVLLHLIEETARHAGHADIIRESIDGATCWTLMAAAEDWPVQEWA